MASRIFNFALAYFLPPSFKNITWKTYIIFGVFCTVMIFHIFFTYPETAQKSLEEIDVLFDSDIKPWRSAKVSSRALDERADKIGSIGADGGDMKKRDSGSGDEKQEMV